MNSALKTEVAALSSESTHFPSLPLCLMLVRDDPWAGAYSPHTIHTRETEPMCHRASSSHDLY